MKIDLSIFKSFVVPALIIVTIILIIPFAFIPLLNNVRETNDSLKSDQERLKNLSDKLDTLNSLDEAEINEKLAIVEQGLPVGKDLAPLIVGVQNLAAGSNLLVEGISLSPGSVATESAGTKSTTNQSSPQVTPNSQGDINPDALSLQLKLRGNLKDLILFLSKLQKSKRLSFADIVSFERGDDESTITVELSTPFRPLQKVEGDIASSPLQLLTSVHEATLDIIEAFTNITNIQINEVKTNIIKDPFKGK